MRAAIFTSNQPRHIAFIESIAKIYDDVFVIQECNSLFTEGSEVMKEYFKKVKDAERKVFGESRFLPKNVRSLSIKFGDLNKLDFKSKALDVYADSFFIFGSSYIKGDLCEFLIENDALNLHMGLSPYYRGAACNFWALYDEKPEMVGATIHLLSEGLDDGDIIQTVKPDIKHMFDPFCFGMKAVEAGIEAFSAHVNSWVYIEAQKQNKSLELRYSKKADFTDAVALEYLERLENRDKNNLK